MNSHGFIVQVGIGATDEASANASQNVPKDDLIGRRRIVQRSVKREQQIRLVRNISIALPAAAQKPQRIPKPGARVRNYGGAI